MNRMKSGISLSIAFLSLTFMAACGGSSSTKTTTTQTVAISGTSGTGQSAAVSAAFVAPLVATVTTNGTPTAGVTVTFTAPSSGASGTFAGGVTTATTDASGKATSPVFTANATVGGPYTVTASAPGATASANFSLTNTIGVPATISATSGSGQTVLVSTGFPNPLVATVVDSHSNPVSGVTVTFTAPSSGASGTFAGGVITATTDATGKATSAVFTANATAGGPYTVAASVSGVSTPANFTLTNSATPVEAVTATSGSGQSAAISTAFAAPLVATVMTGSTPNAGVVVTFTAPSSGASGTFAGGVNTATTDANGKATSAVFTANSTVGGPYTVAASVSGVSTPANFSLTNTTGTPATITATGGSAQTTAVATPFSQTLVATVVDSHSNPVSGVVVTFTAPGAAASGTFADTGNNITTASTNASGIATSTVFTANTTAGGPYNVVASAGTASANFALTNANNYVFYLSGADNLNTANPTNPTNYLAVAGAVTIDPNGKVIGGEEDYNDANSAHGVGASKTPITDGSLSVDGTTGLGTLTLVTGNSKIGNNGTETFAIAFVNSNHARVMQFDGTATSSGSLDLQTPLSVLNGGYSFVVSGIDPTPAPFALGGVFSVNGTAITGGVLDFNDNLTIATGIPFTGNVPAADAFGRGTIVLGTTPFAFAYYTVNNKAIRIIDIDATDAAIGSVFSQGSATFTNASLGNSVLAIAGNPDQSEYGAIGQFSTSNTSSDPANFAGVGEANEMDNGVITGLASAISGQYSFSAINNGYGSISSVAGLGGTATLGIYATDPGLNLNDPNSQTGGGGALVLDLSVPASGSLAGGTGVLVPQTDTSTSSFANNYVAGWQNFNTFTNCDSCEFDMLAQGSMVANGALTLTGDISDPFKTWSSNTTSSDNIFSGSPLADTSNPGRYSMWGGNNPPNPLVVTPPGKFASFALVMYQANGGLLYWLDFDTSLPVSRVFLGSLEQQGDISAVPMAKGPAVKPQAKRRH